MFRVTINNPSPSTTRLSRSPTTLNFNTGTFDAPQTVTVTLEGDNIASGDETFSLSFTVISLDSGYHSATVTPVTVNVVDDDIGD